MNRGAAAASPPVRANADVGFTTDDWVVRFADYYRLLNILIVPIRT